MQPGNLQSGLPLYNLHHLCNLRNLRIAFLWQDNFYKPPLSDTRVNAGASPRQPLQPHMTNQG